jgi:hypothetical protein
VIAISPNNRKHLTIVRMVTSWRLVAFCRTKPTAPHISGRHDCCQGLLNRIARKVYLDSAEQISAPRLVLSGVAERLDLPCN